MRDKEFLRWIYERLVVVHGENTNYDYMKKLNAVIEAQDPDVDTLWRGVARSYRDREETKVLKDYYHETGSSCAEDCWMSRICCSVIAEIPKVVEGRVTEFRCPVLLKEKR